ncbi:MAG: helix-turn-helix transcriptional regulator [Tissierellia bacterium]|nr:helix-turn-helix transcriptional regulator [Tissierellia bacterium]
MSPLELNERQYEIINIVKDKEPITGDQIAKILDLSRATIRPDLSILTMVGILGARPKVGYFYTGKTRNSLIAKEIREITVDDRMSLPVVLDEESSIYDSIVAMFLEDVGSIFITSEGYLMGVVSRKDLLRSALGKMDLNNTPVGIIMTRMPNVIFVKPKDSIYDAAKGIEDHNVDSLPVVEEEEPGKYIVIGRITKTNITRLFVELGEGEFKRGVEDE